MDEFKKIARKIFVGIGINNNNQITTFCNLQSPGLKSNHSFNLQIDNNKSAKLQYTTPNFNINIFKNETNPLKIPNQGLTFGTPNFQTILSKFKETLSLKVQLNHQNGKHIFGIYDTKKFFIKNIFEIKNNINLGNFFYTTKFNLGNIFGKVFDVDKFYLESIKGYKNNLYSCGYSFIQINQVLGVKIYGIDLFMFNELGFVSKQNDLYKTGKRVVELIVNNEADKNIFLSVGVGITPPFKLAGKCVSGILALPLINSENKVQFTLETDF